MITPAFEGLGAGGPRAALLLSSYQPRRKRLPTLAAGAGCDALGSPLPGGRRKGGRTAASSEIKPLLDMLGAPASSS